MVATVKETKKLTASPIGKDREVSHFTNEEMSSKLMSMGVVPGSRIRLIRKAPFGGGYYVRVDNFNLALRREEAESIVLK